MAELCYVRPVCGIAVGSNGAKCGLQTNGMTSNARQLVLAEQNVKVTF